MIKILNKNKSLPLLNVKLRHFSENNNQSGFRRYMNKESNNKKSFFIR